MRTFVLGKDELGTLAQEIIKIFPHGGIIILRGDLAAGKTTLVSAFAKEFSIAQMVTSPTFSLQQCYGENIFHYDIYNHGIGHFVALGMLEELEKEGYHFVEWGDESLMEILKDAELEFLLIDIEKSNNKRVYKVDDAYVTSR